MTTRAEKEEWWMEEKQSVDRQKRRRAMACIVKDEKG